MSRTPMRSGAAALIKRRMFSQRLWGTQLRSPVETVGWLTAMQAQDYAGAKWGVALRTRRCSDEAVEAALQAGQILRTHVLRPTWHLVLPADIRWLLALSAPRVRAALGQYDRALGIDADLLARSQVVLRRELEGDRQRTRVELAGALSEACIPNDGSQRLAHLMMHAELSALICSGARRGNQFTYALLEERAAPGPAYTREQALLELTRRYFASHGPAQAHDFAWWSGLTISDARAGIALAAEALETEELEGKTYWLVSAPRRRAPESPHVLLLPNFDEHVVAYKDHRATFVAGPETGANTSEQLLGGHTLLLDGRVVGTWRRTLPGRASGQTKSVIVELRPQLRLGQKVRAAVLQAAEQYATFLGARLDPIRWPAEAP